MGRRLKGKTIRVKILSVDEREQKMLLAPDFQLDPNGSSAVKVEDEIKDVKTKKVTNLPFINP